MKQNKRLMADLSATIIHHGHVRLLRRARAAADKKNAALVIGLTADDEVRNCKGYTPELPFAERKEILEAFEMVDEVVETPWLITEEVLTQHNIDFLYHGDDNSNPISPEKLITAPRTEGVSSSDLRKASVKAQVAVQNSKIMLTPGPGAIPPESALNARPLFGRGDGEYTKIEERVMNRLKRMSGHEHIARLQGSATLALEISIRNFIYGRVLVIDTGYYCQRLVDFCRTVKELTGRLSEIKVIPVTDFLSGGDEGISGKYDWIVSVYSETSQAMKNDIERLYKLKTRLGAKLFLDATASIGLEPGHDMADLIAYSSCKGLFAVTGAAFVAWNGDLPRQDEPSFYLNIDTHLNKLMTGPYHPVSALDAILNRHGDLKSMVAESKSAFLKRFGKYLVHPPEREPLIATRLSVELIVDPENLPGIPVVFYTPRSVRPGHSITCHFTDLDRSPGEGGLRYRHLTVKHSQ